MITNEQLNEIFKPLFDAVEAKGHKTFGVMFHPACPRLKAGISFLKLSEIVEAENFDELLSKINALPAPETEEERIRREILHHENKANELRAQLEAAQ